MFNNIYNKLLQVSAPSQCYLEEWKNQLWLLGDFLKLLLKWNKEKCVKRTFLINYINI